MDRIRRAAVLLRLMEEMHRHGSWCGETHVQKASFILQDFAGVPMDREFILYKYGPFSFGLRNELTALRADGLLELEAHRDYGPRLVPTGRREYIEGLSPHTLAKYADRIGQVANIVADKGVAELERLATAFFVTSRATQGTSAKERADELVHLKPHISLDLAVAAVDEVDKTVLETGWSALPTDIPR